MMVVLLVIVMVIDDNDDCDGVERLTQLLRCCDADGRGVPDDKMNACRPSQQLTIITFFRKFWAVLILLDSLHSSCKQSYLCNDVDCLSDNNNVDYPSNNVDYLRDLSAMFEAEHVNVLLWCRFCKDNPTL